MHDVLLQCEIISSKAAELIDEQAELSAMIEHMKGAREHEGNEICQLQTIKHPVL